MQTGSEEGELVAGRYRLRSRLSSGGMGTVWRAEDELLQRLVAVKEVGIPAGLPEQEVGRLRQRYLREARAAARLRHENVVVVHDVISEASKVWIVMELFDTPDLAALVREEGPLEPAAVARIGLQMLDALAAAHAAGVLHRDVKPANVLVCENGRAVLTDFGVASVTGDASLTATGQLIGSPAYLAPERLTGGTVGPASDLWSLGCTLYAAVEGQSPFWRDEPFAILSAITVEALPQPRLAGALTPVLLGLLEKDQAQRWGAEHTRAALEQVMAGQQVEDAPSWGAPVRAKPAEPERADESESAVEPPDPTSPDPEAVSASAAEPASEAEVPPVRPRRRGRRIAVGLVMVLLIAGGAAGGSYALDPSYLKLGAQAEEQNIPEKIEPKVEPVTYTHPDAGYTIVVTSDWSQTEESPTRWRFTRPSLDDGPASGQLTLVVETKPSGGKASLDIATAYDGKLAADAANFPRYQRTALGWLIYGQYRGAGLEFTYLHPQSGLRHVVSFRTVLRGVSYEISLDTAAGDSEVHRPLFAKVAASLQLPE